MAYAEKYYHQYCNTDGITCRISILKKDYSGSVTELEAQPDPFIKKYENSSDLIYEPIRPSFCEVQLVFGTDNGVDMEEIWTADEREYQIIHTIDGNVDWIGYCIPNGFEYVLRSGAYYATLTGADGLSVLEDIDFSDSGTPYGTQDLSYNTGFSFPWVLIATEILRKLDLDLDLWTCVDVYEQSMTKTGDTRDADPLATSYANVKTYINDTQRKDIPYWADANQVMNCKEVLESLCYVWGAKVYQSEGVWRIKRVNADMDYGTGSTQRYWRKYNTLAVYLGFEEINKDITIPCSTIAKAMIGTDHSVYMRDVYGAFRVNYKYSLVQEGDQPVALLKNGDFEVFNNTSKLAAPQGWFRWKDGNNWHLGMRPKSIPSEAPGGYTTCVEIGIQDPAFSSSNIDSVTHPWNSLRHSDPVPVTKGDSLTFQAWVKYEVEVQGGWFGHTYSYLCRMTLVANSGKAYFLRNNTDDQEKGFKGLSWIEQGDPINPSPGAALFGAQPVKDDVFFVLAHEMSVNFANKDEFLWREFNLKLDEVPESGTIILDLMNLVELTGQSSSNFPTFKTYWIPTQANATRKMFTVRDGNWNDNGGWLNYPLITGVKLGRIPDPSEFADQQDYIYENQTGSFTLEVDPIEVLNGDSEDPQQISNISVPTNVSGGKNFWDQIDDKYGKSSLGLITCKSIINLYITPFRMLEGTIKASEVTIDTRFEFEALPGKKFCLSRASFNEKKNYIEGATFFEITDTALAAGGTEGANGLDPQLVNTGRRRCAKSGSNLNTGYIEFEQVDINPNSETYGQTSWNPTLFQDFFTCPLGQPSPYYFGSDDSSLDTDNLDDTPFTIDPSTPKEVTVPISNDGGEYVYFVHLESLGVVERIYTDTQENIISDFQYLSDITVDGFDYRVLRQDYITADFEALNHTFVFNLAQIPEDITPPVVLTTYYRLNSCGSDPQAYTTLVPGGASQRYVWPQPLKYYIWDGTTTDLSSPPSGWNGSIQIATGQFGCP